MTVLLSQEPVFEVTGLPDNVDRAKKEVEHHIALRTGGIIDPTHPEQVGNYSYYYYYILFKLFANHSLTHIAHLAA